MGILTRMHTFIEVVYAEGFSAASRKTGHSKAVLSKHVRELEDSLGVLLLKAPPGSCRSPEQAMPIICAPRRSFMKSMNCRTVSAATHARIRERIKMSAPPLFVDAPIGQSFINFCVAYPDVNLDIHLDDPFFDLIEKRFDLAIRITKIDDSSLIAQQLSRFIPLSAPPPH